MKDSNISIAFDNLTWFGSVGIAGVVGTNIIVKPSYNLPEAMHGKLLKFLKNTPGYNEKNWFKKNNKSTCLSLKESHRTFHIN